MNGPPLRLIFAGTPEFAATHLRGLLASQHQLVAVYTQPDRRSGRGKKLQASPVKKLAVDAGIDVFQPSSLRQVAAQQPLAQLGADVMVVVAYGLILPREVLDAPRIACLNVHASLLPRWRGAAPIQRAIEAGDRESGVTIMQMDAGLDTGAMLATARCAIGWDTTAASLHDQLAQLGVPLLLQVLDSPAQHLANGRTQNDALATYASKILKPEAAIDWSESAETIARKIRAFNPFPISYTLLGGDRLKLHAARAGVNSGVCQPPGSIVKAGPAGLVIACGEGQLHVTRLQLPGGKALTTEQMLNARSAQFAPGTVLGSSQTATEPS